MNVMKTGATKRLSTPKSFGGCFASLAGAASEAAGAVVLLIVFW
jgi:hypothetical protein